MPYLALQVPDEWMVLVRVLQLGNVAVGDLHRLAQMLTKHDHVDHSIWIIAVLMIPDG